MRSTLLVLLTSLALLSPASAASRLALVIGNADYLYPAELKVLPNPLNDAEDMEKKLVSLGYTVTLKKNLASGPMKEAIEQFASTIQQGDVVVFFYAGHGLALRESANDKEGKSYLAPIDVSIKVSERENTRIAISVERILEDFQYQNPSTCVMFLDNCRDNPYATATRSGASRGIPAAAVPQKMSAFIAYATAPGSTADDGTGRNGLFTSALLNHLDVSEPIPIVFQKIRRAVKDNSQNKQIPFPDDRLLDPDFKIYDPNQLASSLKSAQDLGAAELAKLEAELKEREKQKASFSDKSKLEEWDQQQKALAAKASALKQAQEALEKREQEARLAAEAAARENKLREEEALKAAEERKRMADRATEIRKQLEASQFDTETPDQLLKAIVETEKAIVDIEVTFNGLIRQYKDQATVRWNTQISQVDKLSVKPWETDKEFDYRKLAEKASLEQKKSAELADKEREFLQTLEEQKEPFAQRLTDLNNQLATRRWKQPLNSVVVDTTQYLRNERVWPLRMKSKEALFPLWVEDSISLRDSKNIEADYNELDQLMKSSSLSAEVEWKVVRLNSQLNAVVITQCIFQNLQTDTPLKVVNLEANNIVPAVFETGQFAQRVPLLDPSKPSVGQRNRLLVLPWVPKGSKITLNNKSVEFRSNDEFAVVSKPFPAEGISSNATMTAYLEIPEFGTHAFQVKPNSSSVIFDQEDYAKALETKMRQKKDSVSGPAAFRSVLTTTSLLTGVAGFATGAVAGYYYMAGQDAYTKYQAAKVSSEAARLNSAIQENGSMFTMFGIATAGLLGTALTALILAPDEATSTRPSETIEGYLKRLDQYRAKSNPR